MKQLENKNAWLKKFLAEQTLDVTALREFWQNDRGLRQTRRCRASAGRTEPLRTSSLQHHQFGIKALACWLNERGHRTRTGGRFGVGALHKILTNTVYIGKWTFNKRCAKTHAEKPASEHVVADVPAIIESHEFEAVAASLKSRNPRVAAPRSVTGPVLLTSLAVCASCGGAMTSRTGTSRSGVVHKYYACSTCARQGKTACKGPSIPMARLDTLVTDHLIDRLFHPERLTAILASVSARRAERALEIDGRLTVLQTEVIEAAEKLKRLYKMVEDGITDLDDLLKERLASLKLDRDRAQTALDRVKSQATATTTFDPEAIERFGRTMRENIQSGDTPFRKAYIRAVIDRIEVDDRVIRIVGDKNVLEQAVNGRIVAASGVRRCVPKWRSLAESNRCFRRERATS